MTHWVSVLFTKPEDLGLLPETHTVEGQNSPLAFTGLPWLMYVT